MKEADLMGTIDAARRFAPRALEVFPGARVYLFGSYVKGYATEASDIDVLVVLKQHAPGETPSSLWDKEGKLWEIALDVDDRIEPVVRTLSDTSGFTQAVMDYGIRVA